MARRWSDLKRRRYHREPKRRFIVFCEGAKSEPAYFSALKRTCTDALIEIQSIPAVGVAYTTAEAAVEHARSLGLSKDRRKALDSFEEGDQVWAVFDRDDHPRYEDAVKLCEAAGVGVGRSNPCFELWFILHIQNYDKPDGRHAVQAYLRELRPEYKKNGAKTPNCDELVKQVKVAEARAEKQLARREEERRPFGAPSTTVGRLTRVIREAAERARKK